MQGFAYHRVEKAEWRLDTELLQLEGQDKGNVESMGPWF